MIKLGVNSVLFKAFSFAEAARAVKLAGYDGIEICAVKGMCEHLDLDNWAGQKNELIDAVKSNGLEFFSTEVASLDRERLLIAFEACAAIGIPIVNVGPGGLSHEPGSLDDSIGTLRGLAKLAAGFGVTLCCKAHVGAAIYNTPTTLAAMNAIEDPAFGIDMDPSHIWRAGEDPVKALPPVVSRVKHIHIRDCKGPGPSPGVPALQTCGRGDIDLYNFIKAMIEAGYDGPVCLEVIGDEQPMTEAAMIAAESYGYMNAVMKSLGAR